MINAPFQIEKNVPIKGTSHTYYPFDGMEIGDSIFAAGNGATNMRRAAYSWAARNGRRFTCRTVDGGIRVWRVK